MAQSTPPEAPKPSNFDSLHAPETALIDDCVHCGFCLPACPTYVLWGEEMDSPRGRIYMMKKSSQGEAPLDRRFGLHMDNCLGCMACMTACPSGVQYNKLIEDTRAQVERNIPRRPADTLFRGLLFATFPYANRLRLLALPLLAYQRSGLQKLVRAIGVLRLIPKRLRAMESLLPRVPANPFGRLPARVSPTSAPRRRVGMLTGCVQQVFFEHVNQATVRVLAAEGCEIVIPPSQPCCGALLVHAGLEDRAAAFARRMIAAFAAADVDTIVINAAGCGSTMKEYGHLLRDDPVWAARAAAFSAKCRDISEILCELPAQSPRHPLPMRAAYHDACHLRHAQAIYEQPRLLLAAIPGLEVCRDRRSQPLLRLCRHLQSSPSRTGQSARRPQSGKTPRRQIPSGHLRQPRLSPPTHERPRRRGLEAMPAFHMVELLDASIRGVPPAVLLEQQSRRQ